MQSREEPLQLKMDTYNSIFFKPTRVGCSTTSPFTFHNPSRLPLEFDWRVSQQYRKMLAVQPARGLIQPNENLVSSLPHHRGPEGRAPAVLTPPSSLTHTAVRGQACDVGLSAHSQLPLGQWLPPPVYDQVCLLPFSPLPVL